MLEKETVEKIKFKVFGLLVGLFLIVSGILLPFDIYISTLLVVMGAVMITACIACLDYITSYRR